ncbi:MAG TPA: hypothetical protein VM328_12560 [Fimbriimonadaceae bacterium]|nr:hypothetical protein [Fimbriimonadaceae bacterium]
MTKKDKPPAQGLLDRIRKRKSTTAAPTVQKKPVPAQDLPMHLSTWISSGS